VENQSLAKALALIEAMAFSPHPLTAVHLSRALKITRPTIYRILKTLAQHEFVTREDNGPFYRLSFKLLDLGHRVLEQTDLIEATRPILRKLSAECRETVHLAVPQEGGMVYLDKLEGSGPFCTNSRIGRTVPMHCTSLGKAVLAFLPPQKAQAALIRRGMPRYTPRTIVGMSAMARELARIRRQGYAIDDVEFEEGVRCTGAPILDHRGIPIAAISVSAPVSRMPLAKAHEVGVMLREAGARASRAMGWGSGASRQPVIVLPVRASKPPRRSGGLGPPPLPQKRPDTAPHQAKEVIGRR
jgi:IclR family acetate operon transcriptional repressor